MVWQVQVVVNEGKMLQRICSGSMASGRRGVGSGMEGNKPRLYVLRRRFVVVVDARGIAVKVLGSTRAWWKTAQPERVEVKKRLVKITDENKRMIMIRLASEEKALEFATAVGEKRGIDPFVHSAEAHSAEDENKKQLEEMAALFMSSPEFRAQIQQLHGHLDEL